MNVARAIFEEFKTKIQDEINTNFVLEAYGDERAEAENDAYHTAIDCLDEITRGKTLSVRQEDELYEKGYNDALKDVEEFIIKAENVDITEDMRKNLQSGGVMVMPYVEPSIEIIPTIEDYKSALLKKIFPYDAVDKKQYSINAYAVERAIIEVAEELYDAKRNN